MAVISEKTGKGDSEDTRQRLLDAGEELFCERGFKGTSIRRLAVTAKCNLAAVNYHFGSKDNLYVEVWRRLLVRLRRVRLESIQSVMEASSNAPSLEQLLRSFAHSFVGPLVEEKKADCLMKLMAREMLDQHLPADMLINEVIKPTMTALGQALTRACPELDESRIWLVMFSIVGQLLHIVRMKTMFAQTEDTKMPPLDMDKMIDHIVKFSAAGIDAYAGGKTG